MKNIIRISLKEIMSKRILHMGIILTIAYLFFYGLGLHYVVKDHAWGGVQFWYMQEMGYQFLTLGLYISTFLSGALAILGGAGSISHEIENGTILALASRPLSRQSIVLGKFIAYGAVTAIYSAILVLAVSILVEYYFKLLIDPFSLLKVVIIFMLFPIVILSFTHFISSLLSTLATGVTSFMLFTVAIIGGFIEQMGAMMGNVALVNIGIVSSLLMPTDAIYRLAVSRVGGLIGQGAIADFGPFGTASTPSLWMLVYALVYIAVMIFLAVHFFKERDL